MGFCFTEGKTRRKRELNRTLLFPEHQRQLGLSLLMGSTGLVSFGDGRVWGAGVVDTRKQS